MDGLIEEKVFALKLLSTKQVRRRLESLNFKYTNPIRPNAGLQGYWQTPQGPMVTIWLAPLTQADMEVDRTLKEGEQFVRFYLHINPFKGGPQYPPIDGKTGTSIWNAIDTATGPFSRFVAGTKTRAMARRYGYKGSMR